VFEKRTLLAALAAFVTMFLVSWLLFGVVFAGQIESMQEPEMMGLAGDMPNMPVLMLSYLVLALMMAFIFKFGYEGGAPVAEGIRFGIFVWLLVSVTNYLEWVAWDMMSWGFFAFNGVLYLVQFVLGGLVIGLILGRKSAPTVPASV
jgi:hypothetical protein